MPSWIRRWLDRDRRLAQPEDQAPSTTFQTEFSATVFSGDAEPWASYLGKPREDRYCPEISVAVLWSSARRLLSFRAENGESRLLAACLNEAYTLARERAERKPFVARALNDLVFGNPANAETDMFVRVSADLPSEGAREVTFDRSLAAVGVNLVMSEALVMPILEVYQDLEQEGHADERLGALWPLFSRVLTQLGYPNYPRDRFVERIDLTTTLSLISVNLLYEQKRGGRLVPNRAGRMLEAYLCQRDGFDLQELHERHPYCRLLNELAFLLDERQAAAYADDAAVLARQYLDERYLRLSLAGIMPDTPISLLPMRYYWDGGRVTTPPPRIGRYGIFDQDDLKAWKRVDRPFRDLGYTLLRQVGMGEFGRVYEAVNQSNPHLPQTVAIKVDRLLGRKKKKSIQNAETILSISRALAGSPHVIRIYDAGRLARTSYTYHILQLVDGETLDNLVGITGTEHASVSRPQSRARSEQDIQQLYWTAFRRSRGEGWRRRGEILPFTQSLTLSQLLDLLTSIGLWLEKVHELGYAINDLKNGNLMVSRRGQVKGIDMDSYSPIGSDLDKVGDFFFLGVSLLLILLNIGPPDGKPTTLAETVVQSPDTIRQAIREHWSLGDVRATSKGRVETAEVIELLGDLVVRGRDHSYSHNSELFSADLNRLVYLKRLIFLDEIVLD